MDPFLVSGDYQDIRNHYTGIHYCDAGLFTTDDSYIPLQVNNCEVLRGTNAALNHGGAFFGRFSATVGFADYYNLRWRSGGSGRSYWRYRQLRGTVDCRE